MQSKLNHIKRQKQIRSPRHVYTVIDGALLILHGFVPFPLSLRVGRLPQIHQDIWEMCPYSSLTTAGEHAR